MVETDVEFILGEIRDRVRATHQARGVAANDVDSSPVTRKAIPGVSNAETLALISSYLTTTARAWDQFPPLVSNRKGFSARFELWLKRFFSRRTRWYVWEQVNFNAAVHHALRDLLSVLVAYEQELEKLRAELAAARSAQGELAARHTETQEALRRQGDLSSSQNAQLNALLEELRERDQHLREEQRVCFKQVSLELSEAVTLEDRSRSKTETLLAEIQRRLEELEKNEQ